MGGKSTVLTRLEDLIPNLASNRYFLVQVPVYADTYRGISGKVRK